MKLFIYQHCPFCLRARMIFGLKNQAVETSIIMEGDTETPTRMIGKKMLPILQKDDGTYMGESMDIVHYVDSQTGLKIANDAVDPFIQKWADDHAPIIFQLAIPRFTRAQFAELATPGARHAYVQRETLAFGDLNQLLSKTPELVNKLTPALDTLDQWLAQHHQINTNDFILLPLLRSLSIVKDVNFKLNTLTYMQRVSALAGVDLLFEQAM